MHNGNDQDDIIANDIEHPKRKDLQHGASNVTIYDWIARGALSDPIERRQELIQKAKA